MFNPGKQAEEILPHLSGGHLFAYLFRRFGYPNFDWDQQKNLVSYAITTPMKGVFLTITPYMGGDAQTSRSALMFGYCITSSIEDAYYTCLETGGGHAAWQTHPLHLEGNQALRRALQDLLRPVYVRDIAMTCYGQIHEDTDTPSHVEAYDTAGYALPDEFFQSIEIWEQFIDALSALGKGSLKKGIQSVITLGERTP